MPSSINILFYFFIQQFLLFLHSTIYSISSFNNLFYGPLCFPAHTPTPAQVNAGTAIPVTPKTHWVKE